MPNFFYRGCYGIFRIFLFVGMLWLSASMASEHITVKPYRIVGWHWYNQPLLVKRHHKKEENNPHNPNNPLRQFYQLSPMQQLRVLQVVTTQRRAKAILSGKVADIAAYKQAQDFWVRRATAFTVGWQHMLLRYPQLDYSLTHSSQNFLAPVMQGMRHQSENQAIHRLAQHNGFVFFYRGASPQDHVYSGIVSRFAERHHLTVIPVSEDGQRSAVFSDSRIDAQHKKAQALGIQHFPALVLVNPETQRYQVVSYGVQSESLLADRLLKIATHWQAGF